MRRKTTLSSPKKIETLDQSNSILLKHLYKGKGLLPPQTTNVAEPFILIPLSKELAMDSERLCKMESFKAN